MLKEYQNTYDVLPALEYIIAQSMYQNTVHVYQNETKETELLSFTARSEALIKVTQAVLKRLEFTEENINKFNSKIAGIIDRAKEMFSLELDILNHNMLEAGEINTQINEFNFIDIMRIAVLCETKDESQNNQQLASLYQEHPKLKMARSYFKRYP